MSFKVDKLKIWLKLIGMPRAQESKRVKRYFDKTSARFDEIYIERKGFLSKLYDSIFRKQMYNRRELTFEFLNKIKAKRVIDVGCGSGRYAVELAKKGFEVVGVDFSLNMVSLAKEQAEMEGVGEHCKFICGDFLGLELGKFDIAIAMGFFDYFDNPAPLIEKFHSVVKGYLIASFPVLYSYKTPFRKIKLLLEGCPVSFYTKRKVENLLDRWEIIILKKFPTEYFVIATPKGVNSKSQILNSKQIQNSK